MLYAIKIFDVSDSQPLRDIHRQEHLGYLKGFDDQTIFAGPILTEDCQKELGSIRFLEFPDRAAAEKHVAGEPFLVHGVQKGYTLHRIRPVVSHTWRDCPRKEGNLQFFIHALDKPGTAATRKELLDAHLAFFKEHEEVFMYRAPLVADEDETQNIGSVYLLDMPDAEAAKALWASEPFNNAGIYETAEFYGWRFGRVFDRFKVAT